MAAKEGVKAVKIQELESLEAGDLLSQMIETGVRPRDDAAR